MLTPADSRALVRDMPKSELHLHLDGSLRPHTALELARTRGVTAPSTWEGMREALVAPVRVADQAELLRAFDLPVRLLQDADALERAAFELAEDKARDNVRYTEIRWAPLLHVTGGLSSADVVAATLRGAAEAGRRHGIEVRLIATLLRSHEPTANRAFVDVAARFLGDGLVGVDLAGPEAAYPDPATHGPALEAARAAGFALTLHAGEWGGAAQVRRALEFHPARIAHGPGLIDDPELLARVRADGTVFDLCPTSNTQAGIVPRIEDHPLARLHRAGIRVTLNTDDLTVSDVTLSEEYANALTRIGVTLPELWTMNLTALDAAFSDGPTKVGLRAAFERWAAPIPELRAGPDGSPVRAAAPASRDG